MARIIFGTLLLFLSTLSFAQNDQLEEHPIDIRLGECLSEDANSTTMGMIDCEEAARVEWDKELNKNYQLLMGVLDPKAQKKLRISQRQWIAYRDREYEFSNFMHYEMEGTLWRIVAAGRRTEIVRTRALELQDYYDTLTEQY